MPRPRPWRRHAEMRSGLLDGDCHVPPADEPFQELWRRGCPLCREQRLGRTLLVRGTEHHPTDRHRWQAGVLPDARPRHDCDAPRRRALPVMDRHLLPLRLALSRPALERGPPFPLRARTPQLPGVPRWCRRIQCRIQTSPWDHRDRCTDRLQEGQSGTTASGGADDLAGGQPACRQQPQLPGTIRQRAVGTPALLAVSLRRAQRGPAW